ncbi:penicillin amidase [Cellulophaga sp. RHA_52]|uniref:penicillin acylase family protein n=1 Tax=Cellulophaga sp. RHA_52 TaxID=1250036 RepID=UPI00119C3FB7|nr:penicillin acylase family protein [Cellulophaga sp. RHA_52]TVZ09833.1 penicillin amidase [Cellulophaga sp. RHA_52]
MRRLKKILKIIIPVLGLLFLAFCMFIYSLTPEYEGEKDLKNLSNQVDVYYDNYGIPHIYGATEKDAIRALGYVHAQDRLWQMELLRRIGPGELSEIFGKDLVETDKLFLSLGIDDYSKETVANLDPNSDYVKLAEAYLDGVNQFQEEGPTPVEFYLTGVDKRPFTLKDIHNTIGYMAFSFAMAHKTDPLLSTIKSKLGSAYLKDLSITTEPSSTLIENYDPLKDTLQLNLASKLASTFKNLPIPLFEGSNSWVLSPQKTKNKAVILANDPHIGFSQPTVWYEAHLSTPTYKKYGYHLAGVPFPLLAHNRQLAYGLTMFENDDVDFYYEETNPKDTTQYKTENGWRKYNYKHKIIKVKGEDDVKFTVKSTRHGAVLNGIATSVTGEKPVAISWIFTQVENKLLSALYGMSHSESMGTFKRHLRDLHAPGLNIMYGDAEGNVAWWATAKLYKMPDSTNTKLILNGTNGIQERGEFLDFSENPHAENPPWEFVYSANNQPDTINGRFFPGYYLPENRAKRIEQLLRPKNDWDKVSVSKMITDVTSAVDPTIVTNMAKNIDISKLDINAIKLLDQLTNWDGSATVNSVESSLYQRWVFYMLKNTFKDELGEELFNQLLTTHFHKRLIAPMVSNSSSIWWDNVTTTKVETSDDIFQLSLTDALLSLKNQFGENTEAWTWGKIHTLEHEHPIGKVKTLRKYFNVGPFPVNGTKEVINNMGFTYSEDSIYKVTSGPSTRRVIDFSDIENSISILPTGQSGSPFSSHYNDQAQMYLNGEFRKMMMNKEEIIATKKSLLVFKPHARVE